MTKSFCFLSKKGGVGKTTFALNCAHALAFSRFRTLLIDMDGQANLTRHLQGGLDPEAADISDVLLRRCDPFEAVGSSRYENLDLISGSATLEELPVLDPKIIREPARFKGILAPLAATYDYVLIDCPPAVNWLTRMVLYAAGSVIVPIQAEPYALQGLKDLIPMLDRMTATAQLYRIVVNMFRANTQLHQSVLKEIEEGFPGRVAHQKVRLTIQLAEAAKQGLSIFEYAPASIGALDMYSLCWEMFELSPETVKAGALTIEPRQGAPKERPEPIAFDSSGVPGTGQSAALPESSGSEEARFSNLTKVE